MAREVFVCLNCEKQVGSRGDGYCKDCGPTQVQNLDDFSRRKDGTKVREVKDKVKADFPEMEESEAVSVAQEIMGEPTIEEVI